MASGSRSFIVTWLLAVFLGELGIDRFYLGKFGTGLLKLLTAGGLGLWYIYDVIITLTGSQHTKSGQPLSGHESYKTLAWIITIVFWLLGAGGIFYIFNR